MFELTLLGQVGDIFEDFFGPVYHGMRAFFCWLVLKVIEILTWLVGYGLSFLPQDEEFQVNVAQFAGYAKTVNGWIPMDWAVGLLVAFFTFRLSFLIFKYFWRVLPWTG